jgi:hypothetical protein
MAVCLALQIHNNYFECNDGEAGLTPTMMLNPPTSHPNASRIAVHADIVLNGEFACPGPFHWPCSSWNTPDPGWGGIVWRYGATYPCTRTVITANNHDMHHPEATAVLAIASVSRAPSRPLYPPKATGLTLLASFAQLFLRRGLCAQRELTMIGSSCGTHSGKQGCSSTVKGYGLAAETHPGMAALVFGVEPGLFDIGATVIEGAGGWGWVNNASNATTTAVVAPRPYAVSNVRACAC